MNETRWTPGPWAVEDPMGPETLTVVPANRPTHEWVDIALVSYNDPRDPEPRIDIVQRDANARLIAAAPDLYKALQSVAGWLESDGREAVDELARFHCEEAIADLTAALDSARAALSRARGEQNEGATDEQ